LLPVQLLLIDFFQSLVGDSSTAYHRAEGIGSVDAVKSAALAALLG
jgi:hypothetical protein